MIDSFLAPLAADWMLVGEVAGNQDHNTLGVEDSLGAFTAFVLGSTSAPSSGTLDLVDPLQYTMTLIGASGQMFYSVDSMNSDGGAAHFLALNITSTGTVSLPGFLPIGVLPGDIILAIEDSPSRRWDWDHNDMVVVMREVPEPASMLLVLTGLGALAAQRRKSSAIRA